MDELELRLQALEARVYKNDLPKPVIYSIDANLTLNQSEMAVWHMIDVTTAVDITLPAPKEGDWVGIWNHGDSIATVKDNGGVSLGTIGPAQGSHIVCPYASGVADWPTKILVVGANGSLYIEGDVVIRTGSLFVTDGIGGNFFEVNISGISLDVTDTGVTTDP